MKCKLGDYIRIKHGFAFKGEYITAENNGVVLVTPGNFEIGGGFKEDKCKFFNGDYPKEYVLSPYDLIVTMTDLSKQGDTLGYSALVPKTNRVYLHNQRIGLVDVYNPKADKMFIYWLMRTQKYQKTIVATSSGSTVKHTSPSRIYDVEVDLPPIDVQKKIAAILSALDEKIAINRAINDNLAAQMRAYFKEYTANNASITGKLKDYSVMQYGYTETATTEPVGPKFLRITDIAQNYIDWNGVPYCPISEENHEKYVLSEGDVVVARTGATVGYAKMVGRNIPDSVFASFLVRIRPIDDEYRYYFGLAITSAEFLNFVQTNAGGSAQPQANPPLLGEFELSIPNKQSLPEFNTKISSFLGVIESNETEISKLHEVKDTMVKMLSSR